MSKIIWQEYIYSDPEILLGKPAIKGTRISVELILSLYEKGWKEEQILQSYPTLKIEHLRAVFNYVGECIKQELFFPSTRKVA